MLNELGWHDLAHRRRDLRLALLFKVVQGDTAVTVEELSLCKADNKTRANHDWKFRSVRANSASLKNSFPANPVADWNSLPASVVNAPSTAAFKSRLAKVDLAD